MPLGFNKSFNVVGVDLGSSTIKIVELEHTNNGSRLVTYGIAEQKHSLYKLDSQSNQKELASLLQEVVKKARVTTSRAVTAISSINAFNTVVDLPSMPDKEIKSAIQWEVKKIIPLPLEKMTLNWQIIPSQGKGKKILLTAAPKEIVEQYMEIFKKADLILTGIETDISALRRSTISNNTTALLIDIGATNTNIAIISNGLPVISRNIDVGSKTITLNIEKNMNVGPDRAEQFRDDIGLPKDSFIGHPAGRAISFVMDNMIIKEVKRVISTYQDNDKKDINKIVISGGCSHLKNITSYFSRELKIETIIGDPWQNITYPEALAEELKKIGPNLAVAVGLALRKKK
ncbi:type IV pilus assembly protein PilM [Patescibacteria group bacterium]|nr:type IV pilus assembly protein PilM [Patescibacteria group bacterium]MBU0964448.1 type IV pilus assembly protein PilM [Patescibacteria group bacterium]